jgi:putative phage-type endonuclease
MSSTLQRTDDWYAARLGKVTASRISDVIARTETGWGASRQSYMDDLIVERITGQPARGFVSPAMRWGIDHEEDALNAYAFYGDVPEPVGFVHHPSIEWSGASPDALVGADGIVEIKCPETSTHLNTVLADTVPSRYLPQIMWQMACTERQWCDFVSYDPRCPEPIRVFIRRVVRDETRVSELTEAVKQFLGELDTRMARIEEVCARERA